MLRTRDRDGASLAHQRAIIRRQVWVVVAWVAPKRFEVVQPVVRARCQPAFLGQPLLRDTAGGAVLLFLCIP